MGLLKAIALGIVQGLTEFLPISSSGHLVLAQQLFPSGIHRGLAFDVCLHFGTLLAVVGYFRADLFQMLRIVLGRESADASSNPEAAYLGRWVWLLGIATVPVAVVGLSAKDTLHYMFGSIEAVGTALLLTAMFLMIASRNLDGQRGAGELGVVDAIIIGSFQAVAIIPGVSRSGSTITGGLLRGLDASTAARFSFLLSIPAILGAMITSAGEVSALVSEDAGAVLAGVTAAALTGWLAIEVMMRAVKLGRLAPFAIYCVILGAFALFTGVF